jgi:AbrB family looped-hinge helix DNA binding protein
VAGFTQVGFCGKLDSKGRITVPARIRNRLDLEKGDELRIPVENAEVRRKETSSFEEAKDFVDSFSNVESFSFDSEQVEVVLRG